MYNRATEVSVRGAIIAIDTVAAQGPGPGPGLHFTLREGTTLYPVEVGPVPYLLTQKVRLHKGDTVTVKGSKVTVSTVPTLIAALITRGTDSLRVRDTLGLPLWRGTMGGRR
jgi:hypothetical protein